MTDSEAISLTDSKFSFIKSSHGTTKPKNMKKVLSPRCEQCINNVIEEGNAKESVNLATFLQNMGNNYDSLRHNENENLNTVPDECLLTVPNTDRQESIVRQCQEDLDEEKTKENLADLGVELRQAYECNEDKRAYRLEEPSQFSHKKLGGTRPLPPGPLPTLPFDVHLENVPRSEDDKPGFEERVTVPVFDEIAELKRRKERCRQCKSYQKRMEHCKDADLWFTLYKSCIDHRRTTSHSESDETLEVPIPNDKAMKKVLSGNEPVHLSFKRKYDAVQIRQTEGATGVLLNLLFYIFIYRLLNQNRSCAKQKHKKNMPQCKLYTNTTVSDEIDGKRCSMESNDALAKSCEKSSAGANISKEPDTGRLEHGGSSQGSTDETDNKSIVFKHHAVIVRDSTGQLWKYQSNGDFKNVFKGKDIANYEREPITTENENQMKSFDFELGVYVNIPLNTSTKDVAQRAEECRTLLAIPYYSFASLNCENIATFLMRGVGNSKQLEEMSKAMWALTDIMDFYVTFYKEFFLILFAMCTLSTEACFLMEAFFIGYIWQRENAHLSMRIKEEKYSARQILKYAGSFILRYNLYLVLSLCSFGIGAHIFNVILFICLPPLLGYCQDTLKLSVPTTNMYKMLREL